LVGDEEIATEMTQSWLKAFRAPLSHGDRNGFRMFCEFRALAESIRGRQSPSRLRAFYTVLFLLVGNVALRCFRCFRCGWRTRY
jgi:hypothetical protein